MKDIGSEFCGFHSGVSAYSGFYSKSNQMHQCLKFMSFWNNTPHVSGCLSVHHREFTTVHTATCMCQTDTAVSCYFVCTIVNSRWWPERTSETCRVSFQNKINLRHWCIRLVFPVEIYYNARPYECQMCGLWPSRMCLCVTGQWFLVLWKNILPLLSRVQWTEKNFWFLLGPLDMPEWRQGIPAECLEHHGKDINMSSGNWQGTQWFYFHFSDIILIVCLRVVLHRKWKSVYFLVFARLSWISSVLLLLIWSLSYDVFQMPWTIDHSWFVWCLESYISS